MGKVIVIESEAPMKLDIGPTASMGFRVVMPCDPDTAFDHALKIDPELWEEVRCGDKTHEVRVFDRDYQVGHVLKLLGYDRGCGEYTGQVLFVRVTCITAPGKYGLPSNVGVLSIRFMGALPPSAARELITAESQKR